MSRLPCLPIALLLSASALVTSAQDLFAASPLQPRTSDAAGVHVVVTPKIPAAGATTWDFEVTFDTHTKPLNDDLVAVSALIDEQGRSISPSSWQGDPPGGHHRKGALKFPAPASNPTTFELQMKGVGGVNLRTFRWELK